jgi:4-diphosphocytidyl-2-C-methyl-D-erythritol kinase
MKILPLVPLPPSLCLRAPAKINWFLGVLDKRPDGYHNILSIMQCISLFDEIVLEHADALEIICDTGIPPEENLAYKAALLLQKHASYNAGVRVTLRKTIPASAGLGGGSSDAAAVLEGLNRLWALGLPYEELASIAIQIGSDVPFFLCGPSAIVQGKGELIETAEITESYILLLVKPEISISSRWAYASLDKLRTHTGDKGKLTKNPANIKLFCQALNSRNIASLGTMLHNDLEGVVAEQAPVIREIKNALLKEGAIISAMSGSGPTMFGVFQDKDCAEKAAETIKSSIVDGWYRVVETIV